MKKMILYGVSGIIIGAGVWFFTNIGYGIISALAIFSFLSFISKEDTKQKTKDYGDLEDEIYDLKEAIRKLELEKNY